MPYKRFSPAGYTFLVIHFEVVFRKSDFFNRHRPYRTIRPNPITYEMAMFTPATAVLRSGRVSYGVIFHTMRQTQNDVLPGKPPLHAE
jgi:hypothetical protein